MSEKFNFTEASSKKNKILFRALSPPIKTIVWHPAVSAHLEFKITGTVFKSKAHFLLSDCTVCRSLIAVCRYKSRCGKKMSNTCLMGSWEKLEMKIQRNCRNWTWLLNNRFSRGNIKHKLEVLWALFNLTHTVFIAWQVHPETLFADSAKKCAALITRTHIFTCLYLKSFFASLVSSFLKSTYSEIYLCRCLLYFLFFSFHFLFLGGVAVHYHPISIWQS